MILDLVLPDGDGLELLREIRAQETSHVAVVMLSSEVEVRDRIRGLTTGADEYVGKPYDTGYLIAKVRELVRRRHAEDAGPLLLIDDSLTFREGLGRALEASGHRVITAATGEDGLRLAAAQRPRAVIVDGILPGMDGPSVIRHLRLDAALRHVPCVLLTAAKEIDAELRALDAGADAFLHKDEDIDVILAKLHAGLARDGRERSTDETESLLAPKRILAVDDSASYRELVANALRNEGYEVIAARSGRGSARAAVGASRRLHPARPRDAGHGRQGDLPPHQGVAGRARYPGRAPHGRRGSRFTPRRACNRRRRLHSEIGRARGVEGACARPTAPPSVRGRDAARA